MSNLFISPNNEYPRYEGDIIIDHPDFDGINIPDGWISVERTERPIPLEGEIVFELFPIYLDGKYVQSWSSRPLTEEEIENGSNHPKSWEDVKKSLPFSW